MPTFARAYPKILKNSRFIFFQSRVIRDTSWPPKILFFFHGTFWVVMAKGFSVKIRVCLSACHDHPKISMN
jgi:hypothetical protein